MNSNQYITQTMKQFTALFSKQALNQLGKEIKSAKRDSIRQDRKEGRSKLGLEAVFY